MRPPAPPFSHPARAGVLGRSAGMFKRAAGMFRRSAGMAMICAAIIGCTPPPDLQGRVAPIDTSAPWPTLFSSAQLAQNTAPNAARSSTFATSTDGLAARAAALRARATRLNEPVLDAASRRRLQAAIARHN